MEIKNYDEIETNNDDERNEHTIIVPDTQDIPNQVEEIVSNSIRDIFSFMAKAQQKPTEGRTDYSY